MKNILITGGTGFVGKEIIDQLEKAGYHTAVLSRQKSISGIKSFYWNYKTGELEEEALKFAEVIIHLAGENISKKRWSPQQKQEIYNSRILSTRLLYNKIKETGYIPQKFIAASAIGYYGTETGEHIFSENDPPGNDFLASVVKDWEKESLRFKSLHIPVVIYRIGVVFSVDGGALKEMLKPLKFKLSFTLGNGEQYLAWVSKTDLAKAFVFAIENQNVEGIYNVVAPESMKQKELSRLLASKYGAAVVPFAIPQRLLELLKGEMSSIILKGSRVSSEKLQQEGFVFSYKSVKDLFD